MNWIMNALFSYLDRAANRYDRKECHKLAFRIVAMGQNNGNPQPYLNQAKDALYSAAREFELLARIMPPPKSTPNNSHVGKAYPKKESVTP